MRPGGAGGGLETAASDSHLKKAMHTKRLLLTHCRVFVDARPNLRLVPAFAAMLIALMMPLTLAGAVEPGEMLKDPALEARARAISRELRCVVCQNQSIDDSNAPLAHDLRVIVRERLAAGDSDAQVLTFVEARYGEFVLLRPRLKLQTVLLWVAPLLLLAGTAVFLLRAGSRAREARRATAPLSPDEQRRLDDLLREDGNRG
jgi:cytochrome c-type biogenesis protein CcmH